MRRISFTGSPEAARQIDAAAARNVVPFTAELGGKSPFIVFADADLDAAARRTLRPLPTTISRTPWSANASTG